MQPGDREPERLFARGDHRGVQAALAGRDDSAAFALLARASLFLRSDVVAAKDYALRAQGAAKRPSERLHAKAIAAYVSGSLETFDPHDLLHVDAATRAETAYFIAGTSYLRNDFDEALAWLRRGDPPDAPARARYLLLRGVIAAAQGNFEDQRDLSLQALQLLATEPDELYLRANAAHNLAVCARDLPDAEGIDCLERMSVDGSLGDDFTGARFYVRRCLAWNRALRGDYPGALRFVARASADARTAVERLYAQLDHASIALFSGDASSASAKAALELSLEYASRIDWRSISNEEFVALPTAAQTFAECGQTQAAAAYCDLAFERKGALLHRLALLHDGRLEALLHETRALVQLSDASKRGAAVQSAQIAYEAYDRIGFSWRAARMAIALLQLTHDDSWKTQALRHLEAYPGSPFRPLVEERFGRRSLTLHQRQVATLVMRGYSTARIAAELHRSPHTVRIHIGRIFRFHGVRNRAELLAKLGSVGAA